VLTLYPVLSRVALRGGYVFHSRDISYKRYKDHVFIFIYCTQYQRVGTPPLLILMTGYGRPVLEPRERGKSMLVRSWLLARTMKGVAIQRTLRAFRCGVTGARLMLCKTQDVSHSRVF
jgi:hypothetical protein